jgi:hypothetical protein
LITVGIAVWSLLGCNDARPTSLLSSESALAAESNDDVGGVERGLQIFRFDTFGDETFWTDTLRMHEVIRSAVSPRTALSVGLKVDVAALPASLKQQLAAGQVNLDDPAVTVALL